MKKKANAYIIDGLSKLDCSSYMENPVVFLNHDCSSPPIGRCISISNNLCIIKWIVDPVGTTLEAGCVGNLLVEISLMEQIKTDPRKIVNAIKELEI